MFSVLGLPIWVKSARVSILFLTPFEEIVKVFSIFGERPKFKG